VYRQTPSRQPHNSAVKLAGESLVRQWQRQEMAGGVSAERQRFALQPMSRAERIPSQWSAWQTQYFFLH